MKKAGIFILIFVIFRISMVYSMEAQPRVVAGNMELEKSVLTIENKVLVPAREIFEAMGIETVWDNTTKTLTAKKNETNVILKIGNIRKSINGIEYVMEYMPVIYDGITYIPINDIEMGLDFRCDFDSKDNIYYLSPKSYTYIGNIIPAGGIQRIIKNVENPVDTYKNIYSTAPDKIVIRRLYGMLLNISTNPFSDNAYRVDVDSNKKNCYICDLDMDGSPECLIRYVGVRSEIGKDIDYDDFIVYTCKNNNIYYCGNIRNVIFEGISDKIYSVSGKNGVYVNSWDYGQQIVLNNTTLIFTGDIISINEYTMNSCLSEIKPLL